MPQQQHDAPQLKIRSLSIDDADTVKVCIVDDDDSYRRLLQAAIKNLGFEVFSFGSPEEFLDWPKVDEVNCMIVDYMMPTMNGLEFIKLVRKAECFAPFIVATGHGTVSMAVDFMKLGAVNVLQKPFETSKLEECIRAAVETDAANRQQRRLREHFDQILQRLTPRELEVLQMAVEGHGIKRIASSLGISRNTVEVHRSNIIRKLEKDSMQEVVTFMMKVGIESV